jgi:hypothetical protein
MKVINGLQGRTKYALSVIQHGLSEEDKIVNIHIDVAKLFIAVLRPMGGKASFAHGAGPASGSNGGILAATLSRRCAGGGFCLEQSILFAMSQHAVSIKLVKYSGAHWKGWWECHLRRTSGF